MADRIPKHMPAIVDVADLFLILHSMNRNIK